MKVIEDFPPLLTFCSTVAGKSSAWAGKDLCLSAADCICLPAAVSPAPHPIVLCCLLCCPQFVWPQPSWKAVHWPAGMRVQPLRGQTNCFVGCVLCKPARIRIERMTNTSLKGLWGMCLISTSYSARMKFSVAWQQSETSVLDLLQVILCTICHKYLGLIKWNMSLMIKLQVTTPYSAGIKKGNKSLPSTCCQLSAQAWTVSGDELMHDGMLRCGNLFLVLTLEIDL